MTVAGSVLCNLRMSVPAVRSLAAPVTRAVSTLWPAEAQLWNLRPRLGEELLSAALLHTLAGLRISSAVSQGGDDSCEG